MLRKTDKKALAFVDYLRTSRNYPVGATHPKGQLDPGELVIEQIKLEESGPLRAVVRLEGKTRSKEPAHVIMRLEAYAGRPFVRLFHTTEFMHRDPRRAYVRRWGIRVPLALEKNARTTAGTQNGPKAFPPAVRTGLRQPNHLNYEVRQQQEGRRHREIRDSAHRCRGWLDLSDGNRGLAVILRNMWQEFPKEILADGRDPALTVYFWPEGEPLMDVRRYSNLPHRSQGESVVVDNTWVDTRYYHNEPFVGISKTHEIMLLFHDAATTGSQMDSLAADFQRPPLVFAGGRWNIQTGAMLPHVFPDDPNFRNYNRGQTDFANFWMFHQRYWGWYGMWDYGDVRHLFHKGYGRIIRADVLARLIKMPVKKARALPSRQVPRQHDYFTPHDWAFDNGRWGWSNTEGLCNLFMQTQYLRTGDRDLYFFAESMARHVRDVDMRHAGQWFGKGTRHGVQHWSDGNHEERQTCHSEFRFHYFLSGDGRSWDFAEQLTRNHYLKGTVYIHAAHSGRLYGLLTRWEMTGDPELGKVLRRYIHALIVPEGFNCSGRVKMPEGIPMGKPRDVNTDSMFFKHFGAMHALIEYYELTQDAKLREAIIKYANARGKTTTKAVAFAARYAKDPKPWRKTVAYLVEKRIPYTYQQVSRNPAHWTGHQAFLLGNVPGGLFRANELGYLYSLLRKEPALPKEQEQAMREKDDRPYTARSALLRESWQSEYDGPEFRAYLTPTRKMEP